MCSICIRYVWMLSQQMPELWFLKNALKMLLLACWLLTFHTMKSDPWYCNWYCRNILCYGRICISVFLHWSASDKCLFKKNNAKYLTVWNLEEKLIESGKFRSRFSSCNFNLFTLKARLKTFSFLIMISFTKWAFTASYAFIMFSLSLYCIVNCRVTLTLN